MENIPLGYYIEFYIITAIWIGLTLSSGLQYFKSSEQFRKATRLLWNSCLLKLVSIAGTYPDWIIQMDHFGRLYVRTIH